MSLFSSRKNFLVLCFSIALFSLALDQWTKWLIVENFQDDQGQPRMYEVVEVTSFFKITRRHNCGVAFSMGKKSQFWDCRDIGAQRWVLAALVACVSGFLVFWLLRGKLHQRWELLGIAFILGGALGNLLDRVVLGYVVDFIIVHHEAWPWPEFPSFNIADSSITVGAGLLIFDLIFKRENAQEV